MIGVIINPYAGTGGRLGLKGSDRIRIKNPETPKKVRRFLSELHNVPIITAKGNMGQNFLEGRYSELIEVGGEETYPDDTIFAVRELINRGVKAVIFGGGDGTARIIAPITRSKVPILGIPLGVKMYSGVFAQTPEDAARIVNGFVKGNAELELRRIMDLDEYEYFRGIYHLRDYGEALTITYENLVPYGKEEVYDDANALADYILSIMNDDVYYIMGPGNTVKLVERKLGVTSDLLAVDVIQNRKLVFKDADYLTLSALTGKIRLIVSPIGGQGFILGRGNQQIGPNVLSKIAKDDIIIISSLSKAVKLQCIRVDTGDSILDRKFSGIYRIIVGEGEYLAISTCSHT
ncbi:ATP-NAD kinase [Sulfolobales archaeon HS-7]|nr:ATP-NAD kinase [Sulfolobales archaeon HS-7]